MLFRKIISIASVLLLISPGVYALNLGSLAKGYYANVSAGETANFKILFWNTDPDSYDIKLTTESAPDKWSVTISPDEFSISNDIGEENIKLPYTDENTKAKVVYVTVKTDDETAPGIYGLPLKAKTILPTNEAQNLDVIPERIFNFQIEITGNESEELVYTNNAEKQDNAQAYPLLIAIFLILSIVLYKKYNK